MKTIPFILLIAVVFPLVCEANNLPECDQELIDYIIKNDAAGLSAAIDNGCNPNCVTAEGYSPLLLAAGIKGISPKITKILLQKGADATFVTEDHINTLHNPAFYANLNDEKVFAENCEKVFMLMLRGADPDQPDSFGKTPRQRNKKLIQCAEKGLATYGRDKPKKKPLKITF